VVDDLHRVDSPAVFEFIDLLLERFTPRWSVVLASRDKPPVALARWRARGEVAEFRQADLRFDAASARALAAGAGLDGAGAQASFERTQGWPAGLQLALNVLRGAPGADLAGQSALIDRQVFEFLATEVLDRLPSALRRFLLSTSVLTELSATRCAALTGDAGAADHLDAIERAGLFVTTVAAPEPTLRLRDLFRDALQHRLQRERPGEVPAGEHLVAIGQARVLRRGGDVTLVAYAKTVAECLQAAQALAQDGIQAEVIDLRTLKPLDTDTVLASARKTGRVVVVHESAAPCGVGAEVAALVAEQAFASLRSPMRRLTGPDAPAAASWVLEQAGAPRPPVIVQAVRAQLGLPAAAATAAA